MAVYSKGTSFVARDGTKKVWWLIDARDAVVGRLGSRIALLLRGKGKECYTPHIDCGDCVVVVNADMVRVTGSKLVQKKFFWHTGHPGGIKERTWKDTLRGKYPERLLIKAIERMMPKDSPLARKQMKSLHVYAGESHPHGAQNPKLLSCCCRKRLLRV